DVTFDENVQGVDASDLLINSEPATNVTFITQREYVWYFPTPQTGTVQITWAPNHGITDTAPLRNPFDGSSGWTSFYNPNFSSTANVVISEFMANNNNGIKDPLDGKRYDWIELHNASKVEVNLAGWHLTDNATNLTKWTFPAIVIQPNAYFLVW